MILEQYQPPWLVLSLILSTCLLSTCLSSKTCTYIWFS